MMDNLTWRLAASGILRIVTVELCTFLRAKARISIIGRVWGNALQLGAGI
jgi:hypothetical protein